MIGLYGCREVDVSGLGMDLLSCRSRNGCAVYGVGSYVRGFAG
jgi:hypothetical protein